MAKIPRYIDDQPKIFFWDLDVFMIAATCIFLGIITDFLIQGIILGCLVGYIFTKVKLGKPDSFLYHALYWHGFLNLRGIPPSYMRRFIE